MKTVYQLHQETSCNSACQSQSNAHLKPCLHSVSRVEIRAKPFTQHHCKNECSDKQQSRKCPAACYWRVTEVHVVLLYKKQLYQEGKHVLRAPQPICLLKLGMHTGHTPVSVGLCLIKLNGVRHTAKFTPFRTKHYGTTCTPLPDKAKCRGTRSTPPLLPGTGEWGKGRLLGLESGGH